jgi:hypothetical protein
VLALVLDKPRKLGPQLQRHPGDSPCSTAFPGAEVATVAGGFPKSCGALAPLQPTASVRIPWRTRRGHDNDCNEVKLLRNVRH